MNLAVVASVLLLAASTMAQTVTLHDSNVTFKRALHSCNDAMGSITFAQGHGRIAGTAGVATEESFGENATISVSFQSEDGTKASRVEIDQRARSVSAKHLRVELNRSVACVLPD